MAMDRAFVCQLRFLSVRRQKEFYICTDHRDHSLSCGPVDAETDRYQKGMAQGA
jgi:hypothetical protein